MVDFNVSAYSHQLFDSLSGNNKSELHGIHIRRGRIRKPARLRHQGVPDIIHTNSVTGEASCVSEGSYRAQLTSEPCQHNGFLKPYTLGAKTRCIHAYEPVSDPYVKKPTCSNETGALKNGVVPSAVQNMRPRANSCVTYSLVLLDQYDCTAYSGPKQWYPCTAHSTITRVCNTCGSGRKQSQMMQAHAMRPRATIHVPLTAVRPRPQTYLMPLAPAVRDIPPLLEPAHRLHKRHPHANQTVQQTVDTHHSVGGA